MIYLATPYSHPDPAVREARFEAACRAASVLMKRGHPVFSPICHSHPIAVRGRLPGDWEFWQSYDREMLDAADELWVVLMDGWDHSKGVAAEIAYATSHDMVVRYLDAEGLCEVKNPAEAAGGKGA